ncbi:MAG TPA: hypothetical protein VMU13_03705 [Candidatus Paceibacterota bacterium]|nr:hypothetical protein [Candidatus Paceibacterota bacterium]
MEKLWYILASHVLKWQKMEERMRESSGVVECDLLRDLMKKGPGIDNARALNIVFDFAKWIRLNVQPEIRESLREMLKTAIKLYLGNAELAAIFFDSSDYRETMAVLEKPSGTIANGTGGLEVLESKSNLGNIGRHIELAGQ